MPPTAIYGGSRSGLGGGTLNIVVFRLLTGCSVAIKSIPHCQWSWSSLNLNEEMLVVLLLVWDLYTPGAMDSIYCALCQTVQTDCWETDFLLDTKSLLYCIEENTVLTLSIFII